MPTYLVTWNEDEMPHEKIKPLFDEYNTQQFLIHRWSCGTTKRINVSDRVFLIKRGRGNRGIFGSGYVTKESFPDVHWNKEHASKGKPASFVEIRFDYLMDPTIKGPVIRRDELDSPEFAATIWSVQGSGKTIPEHVAQELENLWGLRTGKSEIQYPDEISDSASLSEGLPRKVHINVYERDPAARKLCIDRYGPHCDVCGFHFEFIYGSIGKGYIHVHHLVQLSTIKKQHEVDPIEDLRPVCPNCHAMLHQPGVPQGVEGIEDVRRRVMLYRK